MKKIVFILISLILQATVYSQVAELSVKNVIKQEINENKISINLIVSIDNLEINENNRVKIVTVKAKNNNGQIINGEKGWPISYYDRQDSLINIEFEPQINQIKKLDSIEGRIKYFTPTEENKSIVTIKNPLEKLNLSLIEKDYSNIKFIILDFLYLKDLKRESKKKYKLQIEEIEAQNKVQKGSIKSAMDKLLKEFKFSDSELKKRLFFYIEDQENQINKISTYNENGVEMDKFESKYTSKFCIAIVKGYFVNPQNSWTLKLFVENDRSVKEFEFKIQNIEIPEKNKRMLNK
jgi:hypothetical protein